jgi:SAM-dependent methyltransferase
MFSESGDLYDHIYTAMKDYAAEAHSVAQVLRAHLPDARDVLDVACGTGEHARHLVAVHAFRVDGVDLDPVLIRHAQAKNIGGRFTVQDMVDFDLGRTYDAVICMFSSIGYAVTLDRVVAALAAMRRHLRVPRCRRRRHPAPRGAARPRTVHARGNGIRIPAGAPRGFI